MAANVSLLPSVIVRPAFSDVAKPGFLTSAFSAFFSAAETDPASATAANTARIFFISRLLMFPLPTSPPGLPVSGAGC